MYMINLALPAGARRSYHSKVAHDTTNISMPTRSPCTSRQIKPRVRQPSLPSHKCASVHTTALPFSNSCDTCGNQPWLLVTLPLECNTRPVLPPRLDRDRLIHLSFTARRLLPQDTRTRTKQIRESPPAYGRVGTRVLNGASHDARKTRLCGP